MNLVKLITIINWIIIGVLAFVVISETISPSRGGDAATKGLGQAIYILAIILMAVLVILNLMPYKWSKIVALAVVAAPALLIWVTPKWRKYQRDLDARLEYAKPIFPDPALDKIARAIRDGEVEKVKELLQQSPKTVTTSGNLLGYAIGDAATANYAPAEKLECVRFLLQNGAKLDSASTDVPPHFFPAEVGNAALTRLLLENGANPNAIQPNFNRHILFEAISGYQQPEQTVRALLEHGADPNCSAVLDDEHGPVSPLFQAAYMSRWGVCLALLEHGADLKFKTKNGATVADFWQNAEENTYEGGYSTPEDLKRLRAFLAKH